MKNGYGTDYDRDVISMRSSWGDSSGSGGINWGSSNTPSSPRVKSRNEIMNEILQKFTTRFLPKMDPVGKKLKSKSKRPIIIVLDETGSNKYFFATFYAKLPMFLDQIKKIFGDDVEILFIGVGDANSDYHSLQVAKFANTKELDDEITSIWPEGDGGGQGRETYELAALFINQNIEFSPGASPVVIFLGDEAPYDMIKESQARELGLVAESVKTSDVFKTLRRKVKDNCFMLLNKYCGRSYFLDDAVEKWEKLLASKHLVKMPEDENGKNDDNAIVDMMLGIIKLVAGGTLKDYTVEMLDRGQSTARITGVTKSLNELQTSLVPVVTTTIPKVNSINNAPTIATKPKRL